MKKVVIIGGGESGVGAAILALNNNYEVFVTDANSISEKYKIELNIYSIPFEEKGHNFEKLSDAQLVIKSPGVPNTSSIVRYFKNDGVKIISEIEFGSLYYQGKILSITGSNGKTTTAGLLYHLMHTAGYDVALGGNYGISFCRLLTEQQPAYMVLEISSFQLDDCYSFKPFVATILNITPDHLDRYAYDFDLYAAAKFRICQSQDDGDYLLINGDDKGVLSGMEHVVTDVNVLQITSNDYISGIPSKEGDLFELTLKGKHNLYNAATVVEIARLVGMSEADISKGLTTFVNQPHRLELIATIDGVDYINDSKATNVEAVYSALEAMGSPVVWIAGGTDKGNDYESLLPLVMEKVRAIICLGVDNEKLKSYFMPHINVILETTKVSIALKQAQEIAVHGDTVLLSPACASFDLFRNYIDRGNQFKEQVLILKN